MPVVSSLLHLFAKPRLYTQLGMVSIYEAQNKPQLSRQERNADSKVDSITERKPAKMGDTSRQSGMKRKPSNRSKSRTTSCLTNTNEPWYNNIITRLRT